MRGDEYRPDVGPDGVPTLRRYGGALWRRKWLALAPLVVLPALILVLSLGQDPVYEASADVLVNRQEVATTSLVGQTPALDDAGRSMETQARLARVQAVVERTLDAAGSDASTSAFLRSSTVFPIADLLRFTVSGRDSDTAARLAGAYAREYVRYRRELDTQGFAGALAEVRAQLQQLEESGEVGSPAYVRLADRERQLESLRALRVSNVTVVQSPQSGDPEQVAPRPRRNAAIALAAGVVVSLVLVFLAESLTTRPRSKDEYEALLGAPLLARVWLERRPPTSGWGAVAPGSDAIHTLRAGLELANREVGARTIMVTSPHAEEGRSAAIVELGAALARAGRRVVLVDLDLRSSSLTALLGLRDAPGITTVLRREMSLTDVLARVPTERPPGTVVPDVNGRGNALSTLEILGAGVAREHPAEVLSAAALGSVLRELAARSDLVLVDVPPLLDAPDASVVAPRVDALLLVVGAGSSHGPALAAARRAVDSWPVAMLGFALVEGGAGRSYAALSRRALVSWRTRQVEPERVA